MTKDEEQVVKLAAKSLLERLRDQPPPVLVQNWHLDVQSLARVRKRVEDVLNENIPDSYDKEVFKKKCDLILQTMTDYAYQGRKWVTVH